MSNHLITNKIHALVLPILPKLETLYFRWMDEKEYEDFADYEKYMKENFSALNFLCATKRPFGFICLPIGVPYKVQVFINKNKIGWKLKT